MKNLNEVHLRVIDKGLFLPIALRLARDVAKVSFWSPHERAFPTVKDFIGDGFDEIDRVESEWDDFEDVDGWVFPDIGFCGMQQELLRRNKPVWGAVTGDRLEISRAAFLKALRDLGLPVSKHVVIPGMTKLKEHLRDKEDKWIKISRFRGDFETMHWRSWEDDANRLDYFAVKFGPLRDRINFYVFDPIETKIEDGTDLWCIDGLHPQVVIHGMEAKDKGFIGTWQKYADLPEELRTVTDPFLQLLGEHGYRSFFSTEVRITQEGESYFIDPTCRAGSPPSQMMTEMIGNYGEVIWGGANGICVEPEPAARFGVQAPICVGGSRHEWSGLEINPDLERWAKCPNVLAMDGRWWSPPDPDADGHEIGWLVGIGDRLGEAIRHLQHNINSLPDGATCEYFALADLIREIEKAEESGMEFTPQPVPPPEIVVQEK